MPAKRRPLSTIEGTAPSFDRDIVSAIRRLFNPKDSTGLHTQRDKTYPRPLAMRYSSRRCCTEGFGRSREWRAPMLQRQWGRSRVLEILLQYLLRLPPHDPTAVRKNKCLPEFRLRRAPLPAADLRRFRPQPTLESLWLSRR